jgi:hypothetical protein
LHTVKIKRGKKKKREGAGCMPTMDKLTADIAKTAEKLDQLKRQKRDKETRERKKQDKLETRKKILIGATVLPYFPQLHRFKPQKNNAENNVEYAELAAFCSALAADKQTMARLEEEARRIVAAKQAAATSESQ